jgi:hypothetical protein
MPRVERITLMKCMQVFRSRGSEDDFVNNLTSAVEILPMTLRALSRIASEETPSLRRRVRASVKGLSPLQLAGQHSSCPSGRRNSLDRHDLLRAKFEVSEILRI